MKPSIALILLACMVVGCEEPATELAAPQPYTLELGDYMAELKADYVAFEPNSTERDSACRQLVAAMVAMPTDDREQQELSDLFAAALADSDEFKMYDGSIMWIGSQVMKNYPPADRSYLMVLAEKIENARQPGAPAQHKTTYSSLAVGIIVGAVDYPHRVDTYDDRVNYDQWARLHAWLGENLQDLELDPQSMRYRVPGAAAAADRDRPSPTMDDPGR